MKLNALRLSLGLALLAMTQGPVLAADWNYGAGSIKDTGYNSSAVAVPAPAPVPVYRAEYYFRADAGIGLGASPTSGEQGLLYGQDSNTGTFGTSVFGVDGDFEQFVTLGLGVGRYWGDRYRTDFTAETRSQAKVKFNGGYGYIGTNDNGDAIRVYGEADDETTLRGGVFLANAYYDFAQFSRNSLRPYVGVGVGFSWNELKRNHTAEEFVCTLPNVGTCAPNSLRDRLNVQDKTHSVSFAAAVMAGATYSLMDNLSLDMNYRFLYIDGMDVELGINGTEFGGTSTVSIGETYEHQLRMGVRYDIN